MYNQNDVKRILARNLQLNGVGKRTTNKAVSLLIELFDCRVKKYLTQDKLSEAREFSPDYNNFLVDIEIRIATFDEDVARDKFYSFCDKFGENLQQKLRSALFIAEDAADDRLDEALLEHFYELKGLI